MGGEGAGPTGGGVARAEGDWALRASGARGGVVELFGVSSGGSPVAESLEKIPGFLGDCVLVCPLAYLPSAKLELWKASSGVCVCV